MWRKEFVERELLKYTEKERIRTFSGTVHMAERSSDLSEISATSGPSYGGLSKVETSWHHEQSVSPSAVSSVSNLKVTSRPRKSVVWEYFEYDDQLKKSLCQVLKSPTSSDSDRLSNPLICGHEIGGKYLTNLKQHLKKAHPGPYADLLKREALEKEERCKQEALKEKASLKVSKQLTLSQSLQSKVKYDKTSDRYTSITRKLASFIGTSNVPNSLVENLEFCDLLNTTDPRYTPPSRTVVRKEIEKIYIEMKAKIGCYLEQSKKVSLSADIWSKKGLTSSYLGVTAHFFSFKDHRRHCVTLAVRHFQGEGEKGDESEEGEEGDRVDLQGESSEDESSAELGVSDFDEKEIQHEVAFHDFRRVSCFSHSLQLVVHHFNTVTTFN